MPGIDRLREIELELFEEFIKVCERNSLKWYVSHGTLLGAVRYGGFLEWDDDIDVVMPTEDFNRLMVHKEWFGKQYFLQTPFDYGRSHIMKLHKNGTTAFSKPLRDTLKRGGHCGICIDILPLDEIENSGFYYLGNTTIPKEYFEPIVKLKFEHLNINAPFKYRKVLNLLYGYWNWPSGAERPRPHYWFFDTETDYSVYVKRYTGWLAASKGKEIYLFGAGDSLDIWLKDFGLREQVICTFDNDKNKWGKTQSSISINNPEEILGLTNDNSILIVVSIWHQEIGSQLESMGINNYYVFIDGLFIKDFKEKK